MQQCSFQHSWQSKLGLCLEQNLLPCINIATAPIALNLLKPNRGLFSDIKHEAVRLADESHSVFSIKFLFGTRYDFVENNRRASACAQNVMFACVIVLVRVPAVLNAAVESINIRFEQFLTLLRGKEVVGRTRISGKVVHGGKSITQVV